MGRCSELWRIITRKCGPGCSLDLLQSKCQPSVRHDTGTGDLVPRVDVGRVVEHFDRRTAIMSLSSTWQLEYYLKRTGKIASTSSQNSENDEFKVARRMQT